MGAAGDLPMEQKASVENFHVPLETLQTIVGEFGFTLVTQQLLTGGFSSSNFRCSLKNADDEVVELMLKVNNPDHSVEDIEFQVELLSQLQQRQFKTNYLHPTTDGKLMYIHRDEQGSVLYTSMLLDFVHGTPGDKLLAQHADNATNIEAILSSLGSSLAELHQCAPVLPKPRDFRCGFPVSNTGDLLNVGFHEEKLASELVADSDFVPFVNERLQKFRDLYSNLELPSGVIHGDGYLDNTIFETETLTLKALVDWEDACEGPFVLDLAVCAMAACFDQENTLMLDRLSYVLRGYCSARGSEMSPEETHAIPRLMWAAAMAVATWRFVNFNIDKPDSPEETKQTYKVMHQRVLVLEQTDFSATIDALDDFLVM